MQIASPQMMVDIDRDRALALGVTPQQVQDALFSAYSQRAGLDDLRAGQPVLGDPGGAAASISAPRTRCRSCTCGRRNGPLVPLDAVVRQKRQTSARCTINHFGQLAGGDDLVQPAARASRWARRREQVDRRDPRDAHAGDHHTSFQGTVKEFQSRSRT